MARPVEEGHGDPAITPCGPADPIEDIEVRLRFETLLADLSAHFINLPAEQVDHAIEDAQRSVCECLGLDVSALWQVTDEDPPSLSLTHVHRPPGGQPIPDPARADEMFPWCQKELLAGRIVAVSTEQAPPEAARDQESFRRYGIKTSLTFPLSAGGGPLFGAISFNDMERDRTFPEIMVRRLGLVAQIFANALARKKSDMRLRQSEERLSLTTESAGVGLWSLDLLTSKVWVTPQIRQIFCFAPDEELTYDSFMRAIHPDDRDALNQSIQRALQANMQLSIEYRIVCPDGSIRWIISRGHLRSNAEGKPEQFMGTSVDITGRKNAEMEAQALKEELFHVSRVTTMGQLTASIAHEVNQPLAAIQSNAEAALRLLAKETPDLPEIRDALCDIVADDKRAVEVILRLRGMMKKEEPKWEPIEVNDMIKQVVRILGGEAARQGFSLRLELAEHLPAIMGDCIQLQQIMLNLLNNSVEAMIGIKDGLRDILIRSGPGDAGFISIAVSDSGTGIESDDLERVFSPFHSTKPHGLGMGLSVSRSIATAHGGRLWASQNEGPGATFHLSLPAREQP